MKTNSLIHNAVAMAVVLFATSIAQAQVTDTQKFTVTVPSNLTITAPLDAAITHDETDNNQPFAVQQWDVKANALNGANVTFETDQAFTNTTDASFKANARLNLAIGSSDAPANWAVINSSDTTDYAGGDGVAIVEAESTKPGKATFNLSVTFITGVFSELAVGDYEMTVTGTLTAN